MSDQGPRIATPRDTDGQSPHFRRRASSRKRKAAPDRDRFAYRPGNGRCTVERLEDRQLLSSDLTGLISGLINGGALSGSHTFTDVSVGSFLTVPQVTIDLNLTEVDSSRWTGSVSVDATGASLNFDSALTGSITTNNSTDALTGSYTLNDASAGDGSYSLTAQDLELGVGTAFTAEATPVTLSYDPNAGSGQTLVTIGSATATFAPLNNATATISDLVVYEDGFSLGNATVSASSFSLGGILSATSPNVTFSSVSDTDGTLDGTISVGASSVSILANQANFANPGGASGSHGNGLTLTGFTGSYDIDNPELTVEATGATLGLGEMIDATATGVILDYNPASTSPVTVGVASLTATSPLFPGVTGTITNLQASSAGLSMDDATLADAGNISLGGVFQVDAPTIGVSGFDYSTSSSTLAGTINVSTSSATLFPNAVDFSDSVTNFHGSYNLQDGALALSADDINLSFGQVLKADATDVSVNWDGTNASFTVGTATLTSPELPGVTGSLADLSVDSTGFKIASASLTDTNSIRLGSVIKLDGPTTVSVTNLDYSNGSSQEGSSLSGTIGLSFGGLEVLPGSTAFSTTVTNFAGTYNLATEETTLSVDSIVILVGGGSNGSSTTNPILTVTASGVSIDLTPNTGDTDDAVVINVGSASAALNEFGGVDGSVSNLIINNTGFSVGSATLGVGGSNGKGTISAFGGKFTVTNPSVTLKSFGYSTVTNAFTATSLTLAADSIAFNQGGAVSVVASAGTGVLNATINFAPGLVGNTIINAGLVTIDLSKYVTLTGTNITINTNPAAGGDYVQFGSLTASLNVPSVPLTGTATDFALDSNGDFVALAGFGVTFTTNSATAGGLEWPSWMPIQITTLGVSWPKGFATSPTDIDLTLSASVNATFGGAFTLGGSVTDAVIDLGLLTASTPTFPIISLQGAGLSVSGELGGATVSGGAFVAILNLDANGNIIPSTDTTTTVARRIFYGGVEGSLEIGSAGGIAVEIGLSQLGPLQIFVSCSVPILLDPESGLAIQSLNGGINFDSTLTTPTSAKALSTSDAYTPGDESLTTWESDLETAVATQATTDSNTFSEFEQPFTIIAGVTLYDEYATSNAFTLSGEVEIDTTGKLVAMGTLTLGGTSGVSLNAGAFLDLSKVSEGDAQLLFYLQAPAKTPILSVYGSVIIATPSQTLGASQTIDIDLSGEVDLSVPGVQGGIELVGSADFVATPSQKNLELTVSGTASLAPLGQFGELAGQAFFDLNGNTPELYGAFYTNIDSSDIPELSSLGLQISATGFVEFNTTSTTRSVQLTPPGQTQATTYSLAPQSVILDVPNAQLGYNNVFQIDASLYASFALVTLPSGKVDPELDVTFNGTILVGPASSNPLTLGAKGVLIINSAGLAASMSVTVGAALSGVSFDTSLMMTLNSSGTNQSFTVPEIADPANPGKYLAGSGQTYTIPGAFTINGTAQTTGPYMAIVGNGEINVENFDLSGSFDVLVTPTLFRLDVNSMKVTASGLGGFNLTAQGGLLISTSGIAGAIVVSAGSGITGTGGFYSITGSFEFEVNTTSQSQKLGGISIPKDSAAVSVSGDVKVGAPGAQFDVSASVTITISSSGVMLSLYGSAELGPLGELAVGSEADPSTLSITSSGLSGDLILSGAASPIAGTSLTGSFELMFNTSQNLYMLQVVGNLIVGGGAFDLGGNFDLTESSSGFLIGGNFTLSVLGATLASGSFDADIYKDSDGSEELALYAGLNFAANSPDIGGLNFSIMATPSIAINTGSTTQNFTDGNNAPAQTAIFDLQNASIEAFGFKASGSVIATITNGGFDIDIPQSDPISLSFLGLGSMQVYGDFNSDGTFSITGSIGYDVQAGPFELYGGIGATITNTGFSAWFDGGAKLDCGDLGSVTLASISASITLMTDYVEIDASCHVLGKGFSFHESLGSYSAPAHSPGLAFYSTPSQAAAGSIPTLTASAYDPDNNAVPDGDFEWIVTGPDDILNGNQPYHATSSKGTFTPTLGGAGTYYVSLYEVDGYGTKLLKQSTINVVIVPPVITSLNLQPSYLTSGSPLPVTMDPLIDSTNDSLLTGSWTVLKNGNPFGSYTGLDPVITLDPTSKGTVNPDVYTLTLTVVDPYNGTTTLTSTLNTLDLYNLTVNDPGDEEVTGADANGNYDIEPENGLLTLRRAIDIINDNASFLSGNTATIHFAPSLAGDTIDLDQEEFFDHGPNGVSNIGYSDLGIEYPTIIDGSGAPGLTITNAPGTSNDRRLFFVGQNLDDGTTGAVTLTLKNLILKGGDATGSSDEAYDTAYGGAIYDTDGSQVFAKNVTFEDNQANALVNFYFSGFSAQDADGGAVFINAGAYFTATDCTFSGNSANGSPYDNSDSMVVPAGNGYGGAIYDDDGYLILYNNTVAYNTVSGNTTNAGAGIYVFGDSGAIILDNTIVAKDTGGLDIDVSIFTPSSLFANQSSGNLIETSSKVVPSSFLGITGTDPMLGEFAARGAGAIPTYSLLSGSKAIGAGNIRDLNGATTDERGLPREVGGTVDIGAFERQAYVVTNSNSIGPGSLAEALATDDDGSNITFASGLGTIIAAYSTTTTTNGVTTTTNTINGPMTITRSVNIIGPGANLLTIVGSGLTQLFIVTPGINVMISGVTISGGMAIGKGGAIDNSGNLTLDNDLISNNTAIGNSKSSNLQGYGGAIYAESHSSLNLYGDTFTDNLAQGGATSGQAGSGYGGAIYGGSSNVVIYGNDDTFSGNVAEGGVYSRTLNGIPTQYYAQGFGGAIDSSGTTTFTNVTLANNSARDGASGPNTVAISNGLPASNGADFWVAGGTLSLTNSIAADPISGVDIDHFSGSVTGSYNLVMTSFGLPAATPGGLVISAANPDLRPLGYYGGTTPTLETTDGSPVIDAALVSALPATDQRGFTRDVPTAGDLGAFQLRHGWVVTSTADSGAGSLRQTFINDVDETTITFASNLAGQTITLSGGPITLTNDITIDASNAPALTIMGGGATSDRIFVIDSGVDATLKNLTLSNGQANEGGAIYNSGTLSLINDTLSNNTALGTFTGGLSGTGIGGAVYDAPGSTLTATGSTFVNNKVLGASGTNLDRNGGLGDGGAIFNDLNATMTLVDDTFSGNSATGGNGEDFASGGPAEGGGVANSGTARLTNDTFVRNSAIAGAGNISQGAEILNVGTLTLYNSIAADGSGSTEIYNDGTLNGSNNIAMTEKGVATGVVASIADPMLGNLASNGGPTQTYAINDNSPALGGGLASVAPTTDQRGDAREVGGAVDIGSYETQAIPATPSAGGPYTGYYRQGITLDGSGTDNPSNSNLTYAWTITGTGGTLSVPNGTEIDPVNLDNLPVGTYTVTLVVNDGYGGNHIVTAQTTLTILPALTVTAVAPASLAPAVDTAFDTADITFAYPVDLATLDANSIALSQDGGPNLLTGGGNPNFQVVAVTGSPDTYRISGLAAIMAADGDGQYTLTVSSLDVNGAATGVGQGSNDLSASWIYDTTAPSSKVSPLPARSSSSNIVVTLTGSDPTPSAGVITSGVVSYDIWVSTNGGPFVFWTNVPASSPTATYTGIGGDTYGFQSFAHDAAGNVEVKSATVEAGTYVPNQQVPGVHVASVNTTKQGFLVNLTGSAASGGVLDHVDVYVSVDGGAPELIAKVANANNPVTYQAIADGNAHNYAFYAVGTDSTGNVQAASSGPYYDVFVSAAFGAPTANVPIALSVDHGAAGRSFIGSADLIFDNAQGLASLISGNHIHLIKHNLDGTGSTPVSVTGLLSVVDHAIEFNFGALGLGGSPDSAAGDGYYEIDIDDISRSFYFDRIFGDVAGDGIVDANDLNLITLAMGVSIPGELTNLDGSGTVTPLTRLAAIRAEGHKLGAGLHLDA